MKTIKRISALLSALATSVSIMLCINQNTIATSKTMNINVKFGTSYTAQYYVPSSFLYRFPVIEETVHNRYYDLIGVNLNFLYTPITSHVISTTADTCHTTSQGFDNHCQHVSEYNCGWGSTYHCTNYNYIKNTYFPNTSSSTNEVTAYLTAAPLCGRSSDSNLHGYVNGVAFTNSNCFFVRDTDYVKSYYSDAIYDVAYVAGTFAHEIGHMYGTMDHTDSGSANCLWGANHDTYYVKSNLMICMNCYVTLLSNANMYNHS